MYCIPALISIVALGSIASLTLPPLCFLYYLREPTHIIVVIWVQNVQTELMVEIYSKSLVRAIGKVLLMKLS